VYRSEQVEANQNQQGERVQRGKCVLAQCVGTRQPNWNDMKQVYGEIQSSDLELVPKKISLPK
jgi:hypothetical protein